MIQLYKGTAMTSVAITRPILVVLGLLLVAPMIFGSPYYIGIVVDDADIESLFNKSFTPSKNTPYVDLSGRKYYVGKLQGADVVIVNTGDHPVNVASGVQALIDNFHIRGIVSVTTSGSTSDDAFEIGDVGIPEKIAFTGNWNWQQFEASGGDLTFGTYNVPRSGQNLLGSIKFRETAFYTPRGSSADVLYIPVTSEWLEIANNIRDLKLQECLGTSSNCLDKSPKVVYNVSASSSVIYVNNAAYREFLRNQFDVSAVDTGSAAVAFTCWSNGMKFIALRGVSNYADGSGKYFRFSGLGAINAAKAAEDLLPFIFRHSA